MGRAGWVFVQPTTDLYKIEWVVFQPTTDLLQ